MIHSMKIPRQTTGWKEQQNLFHRTLPATNEGPISATAIDWHLKLIETEHHVGHVNHKSLK